MRLLIASSLILLSTLLILISLKLHTLQVSVNPIESFLVANIHCVSTCRSFNCYNSCIDKFLLAEGIDVKITKYFNYTKLNFTNGEFVINEDFINGTLVIENSLVITYIAYVHATSIIKSIRIVRIGEEQLYLIRYGFELTYDKQPFSLRIDTVPRMTCNVIYNINNIVNVTCNFITNVPIERANFTICDERNVCIFISG